MKSLVLTLFYLLILLIGFTGFVYADCTVGVKDCRPSSPGSTTCYWWECEQTGSETTWIFKGTTCTCPSTKSSLELPIVAAENEFEDVHKSISNVEVFDPQRGELHGWILYAGKCAQDGSPCSDPNNPKPQWPVCSTDCCSGQYHDCDGLACVCGPRP